MRGATIIAMFSTACAIFPAIAEEEISIICRIDDISWPGGRLPYDGEELEGLNVSVHFVHEDGRVVEVNARHFPCSNIVAGEITEKAIAVMCLEKDVFGVEILRKMRIDRFTGTYYEAHVDPSESEVVLMGKCKPGRPLF